jgi:hypothetical protein
MELGARPSEEQLVLVTVLQQGPAQGSASNDDSTHTSSSLTPSPSSPSSPSSSSTSPSSSPIRLRNLDDIYARCNFCVVEPENFEEAMKEESWKKAMKDEIEVIEKKQNMKVG